MYLGILYPSLRLPGTGNESVANILLTDKKLKGDLAKSRNCQHKRLWIHRGESILALLCTQHFAFRRGNYWRPKPRYKERNNRDTSCGVVIYDIKKHGCEGSNVDEMMMMYVVNTVHAGYSF